MNHAERLRQIANDDALMCIEKDALRAGADALDALAKLEHDTRVNGPMMLHAGVPSEQWPKYPRGLGIGRCGVAAMVKAWPLPKRQRHHWPRP